MRIHYLAPPPIGTIVQSPNPGRGGTFHRYELVRVEPHAAPHHMTRPGQIGQPRLHWLRHPDKTAWCSALSGDLWRPKPSRLAAKRSAFTPSAKTYTPSPDGW